MVVTKKILAYVLEVLFHGCTKGTFAEYFTHRRVVAVMLLEGESSL